LGHCERGLPVGHGEEDHSSPGATGELSRQAGQTNGDVTMKDIHFDDNNDSDAGGVSDVEAEAGSVALDSSDESIGKVPMLSLSYSHLKRQSPDMPQQDKNSGFRGPKALEPCRFCYYGQATIKSGVASDILDFDVITHGRYHHQAEQMRKQMESLKTATDKRTYGSQ
jgi:hypothetical protein